MKDAFNELHRSTLQTFINAFTYPDKTIYPVASQVKADFYNLARVYTDLVLRPRLLPQTFSQEGHHLELTTPGNTASDLTVSGIVYNEMKGSYSSPDSLMFKAIQENLFPDTVYRHDSGGSPDVIPTLTYEDFVAFHRSYYAPSNARVFLYGNIPPTDHLGFLREMFAGFERTPVDSAIGPQARWSAPRSIHNRYPIGKDEDPAKRAAVNVAWMLSENTDELTTLLLDIVSDILVGSAAGPLRKALIDSHLGEDLSPVTGFERDFRQTVFAVGLRGTDTGKAASIEALILETLRDVVKKGIDQELIEGTLHQVEIGGKEIVRSSLPYGIILMGWAYHTWLYGGDPLSGLNFPRMITAVRNAWQENPRLFEGLIQTWLLDNPHRLVSVMEPSQTFLEEQEKQFRARMAERRAGMFPEDLATIDKNAAALKTYQAEADSPEALASLPALHVRDLERGIETIPGSDSRIAGIATLNHDIFTNGIVYLDLAFDISHIPEDLQPYLPVLGKLMTNMGAAGLNYEQMSKRIALKTGGISCGLYAGTNMVTGRPWQKMVLRLKSLYRDIPDAVRILADVATAGDLSDLKRMEDLLTEKKNRLQAAVVPSGHIFARRMAGASLSLAAWRDEQWHGTAQLQFLAALLPQFQQNKAGVVEKLARLKELLLRKEGLTINITADSEGLAAIAGSADELAARLRSYPSAAEANPILPAAQNRGITIPAQVSYVAQAFPAPGYGHPQTAPLLILSKLLSNGYLYKTIRVQGGAYGGMSLYDPMDGIFSFLSYRDPHVVQTLKAYQDAVRIVCGEGVNRDEMEKAVIGTIGALDRPIDPSGKGSVSLTRIFAGISDTYRQSLREEILSMTVEKMRQATCAFFEASKPGGVIAVYGAEEKLRRANEVLEKKLHIEALV